MNRKFCHTDQINNSGLGALATRRNVDELVAVAASSPLLQTNVSHWMDLKVTKTNSAVQSNHL